MIGAGLLERLRRRDPGYRISLRALRLTITALPPYYICLYAIHNQVLATYVIFGVIAAGIFIQLPGPAPQRSRILLAATPVTCALVALGTLLNVNLWAAVPGVLVIGFAVAFFSATGPRLLGLANGLQLFFIVANFPPHHLTGLPSRLIGAAIGMALTAAAEVLLWPDPAPVSYGQRVAAAAEALADLVERSSAVVAGGRTGDGDGDGVAESQRRATEAIRATRVPGTPWSERPLSAGRRDRALRDCAWTIWEVAGLLRRFLARPAVQSRHDAEAAGLLRRSATALRAAGNALRSGELNVGNPPNEADPAFDPPAADRARPDEVDRLRLLLGLQAIVQHVDFLTVAARVALRGPTLRADKGAPAESGSLWYAECGDFYLFLRQLRENLNPRSAYFQSALRLAVALAAARALTGVLDLSHGFWVLLATLTVMRTSALNTRTTLFHSVAGAVIGAVATGLLLQFAPGPVPYALFLLVTSLLAFGVASLPGRIGPQAALTAMVTVVFAQLAPADWHLAGARILDVVAGGAVGIAAGLLMWPKGAGGELRQRTSAYLRANADLIEKTVAVLTGRGSSRDRPDAILAPPHREFILCEASTCQYYGERPDPRFEMVYWEAYLVVGNHVLHGSEFLLRRNSVAALSEWPEATDALNDVARHLRRAYLDLARRLPAGRVDQSEVIPMDGAGIGDRLAAIATASNGADGERLMEVANWLASVSENLDWLQTPSSRPEQPLRA
ncbi:FUSC family protein [Rugosimonospora acidiphila]|uniref:FUSC family protein n=1 Tax=Rugosimonospora acidiphila TaxID=556531 RepID=A0ABP9S4Z9_9ACTN